MSWWLTPFGTHVDCLNADRDDWKHSEGDGKDPGYTQSHHPDLTGTQQTCWRIKSVSEKHTTTKKPWWADKKKTPHKLYKIYIFKNYCLYWKCINCQQSLIVPPTPKGGLKEKVWKFCPKLRLIWAKKIPQSIIIDWNDDIAKNSLWISLKGLKTS